MKPLRSPNGWSVFMPHCWLVHQFLCRTINWLISFYATLLTGSSVFMPNYRLADQFLCHCQTGSSVFMPHCQSMMVFFLSSFSFLPLDLEGDTIIILIILLLQAVYICVCPHHALLLKGGQGLSDACSNPNVWRSKARQTWRHSVPQTKFLIPHVCQDNEPLVPQTVFLLFWKTQPNRNRF